MSPSRLRQRINTLYAQLGAHVETVLDRAPQFAASLYEHKIKCGKAQCKCAKIKAYRHHMWCVSFLDQGQSKTRVVPPDQRAGVEDLTRAYGRSRDARRQIQQLAHQLLDAVDALGQAQCHQGYKRYTRLAAKSPDAHAKKRKAGTRS